MTQWALQKFGKKSYDGDVHGKKAIGYRLKAESWGEKEKAIRNDQSS
jgi:hypothetical protein